MNCENCNCRYCTYDRLMARPFRCTECSCQKCVSPTVLVKPVARVKCNCGAVHFRGCPNYA